MNNKTIILDLYNTLTRNIKRLQPYKKLHSKIKDDNFKKMNYIDSKNFFVSSMIMNNNIQNICKNLNIDVKDEYIEEFNNDIKIEMESLIYNEKLINEFKNYNGKILLLSNLSFEYRTPIETLKKELNFNNIILSYEVGMLKPNKNIFLLASKLSDTEPENCLMIGDNINVDINGAKNVNMKGRLIEKWW